jgi:hypothetical protein
MLVLANQSILSCMEAANLRLSRVALMCRYADLIEEAVQALNNGGHLLGQIASVHGGFSAASSKSRCLNGPSSEEMPARNAAAATGVGSEGRGRSCDGICAFSISSPAGDVI